METREIVAVAIGEPTMIRALDNIIVDYAFINRKLAFQILVETKPVYAILGYMGKVPTYISLTRIIHNTYDVIIELWNASDWPSATIYAADWDEMLEMSADQLPDNMEDVELTADKSLACILGFELGVASCECPELIRMINDDVDQILLGDKLFKPRPIGIPWPPTLEGLKTHSLS